MFYFLFEASYILCSHRFYGLFLVDASDAAMPWHDFRFSISKDNIYQFSHGTKATPLCWVDVVRDDDYASLFVCFFS